MLIVTAVGLKKKSPIFTVARLEARTGGEEIRALVARPVRTHWDSRALGVRLGMLFMKFVRLFTVFRCRFDGSKIDYGFFQNWICQTPIRRCLPVMPRRVSTTLGRMTVRKDINGELFSRSWRIGR
jgi:hypothetical protein